MARKRSPEEERRSLRPYRRFVRILFFLAILAFAAIIIRGIVRTLDRLPSVDRLHQLEHVDERALRACADDLERIEVRVRKLGGETLALPPSKTIDPASWRTAMDQIEVERLRVVARCRLQDGSDDPVVVDLLAASNSIEALARSYQFLFARHASEGLPHSERARASIQQALETLRARR